MKAGGGWGLVTSGNAAQMREAVRAVAQLFPTAIISGRGREKVEGFVRLHELYYAGSHGMDIVGPRVRSRPAVACAVPAHAACHCASAAPQGISGLPGLPGDNT